MSKATIHTVTISKADIPNGGMKSYKQDDDSIILITRDEDEFSAFDGKCPHAGADLGEGLRCGNRVVCRGITVLLTVATARYWSQSPCAA